MPKLRKRVQPLRHKKWWNKLDTEFSKLIRSKGYCEHCGGKYEHLECSHVVGRSNKTLRWDVFNAFCFCGRCHLWWWHSEPLEASEWFRKTYPGRYTYLQAVKNVVLDRTEEDYKELLQAIRDKDVAKLTFSEEALTKLMQ